LAPVEEQVDIRQPSATCCVLLRRYTALIFCQLRATKDYPSLSTTET